MKNKIILCENIANKLILNENLSAIELTEADEAEEQTNTKTADQSNDRFEINSDTSGEGQYTERLRKAVTTADQVAVVEEYFRKFAPEVDFNSLEPILPAFIQGAKQVGLSEIEFPMITFIKKYYGELKKSLSRAEYIKLHNLYAHDNITEQELAGNTSEGTNNILFNSNLYKLPEDDVKTAVYWYKKLSNPKDWKNQMRAKKEQNLSINGFVIDLKAIIDSNDAEQVKNLRNAIIFDNYNTNNKNILALPVRDKVTILKMIGQFLDISKEKEFNKKASYRKFIEYLNDYGIRVPRDLQAILSAIIDKFKLKDTDRLTYQKIIKDEKAEQELIQFLKNEENLNLKNDILNYINTNDMYINNENYSAIVDELINGARNNNANQDQPANNAVAATKAKSAKNKDDKFEKLYNWYKGALENAGSLKNQFWRLVINAIANSDTTKDGKARRPIKDDPNLPAEVKIAIDQARLDVMSDAQQNKYDWLANNVAITGTGKPELIKLIQYLYRTESQKLIK